MHTNSMYFDMVLSHNEVIKAEKLLDFKGFH